MIGGLAILLQNIFVHAKALQPQKRLCAALQAKLIKKEEMITFQSRLGREPWLQPYTDKTLEQLAKEGHKKVKVICPAFTADCLETLEEIAMQGRDSFLKSGGEEFEQIPCLNESPAFIDFLYGKERKLEDLRVEKKRALRAVATKSDSSAVHVAPSSSSSIAPARCRSDRSRVNTSGTPALSLLVVPRPPEATVERGLTLPRERATLPRMAPDVLIVNRYEGDGSLGAHQDLDESEASIAAGLPVLVEDEPEPPQEQGWSREQLHPQRARVELHAPRLARKAA